MKWLQLAWGRRRRCRLRISRDSLDVTTKGLPPAAGLLEYLYAEVDTWHTTCSDGTQVFHFASGQAEAADNLAPLLDDPAEHFLVILPVTQQADPNISTE